MHIFFVSLDRGIAWNDPRYGPCRSRHACGRYHSLLYPASLNDGLIRRDRRVPYDLLVAIPHWAQPPEGAYILSQEKLRGPQSANVRRYEVRFFTALTGARSWLPLKPKVN